MNAMQEMVRDWHVKFGVPIATSPAIRRASLRAELIREEAAETIEAIERGDLVEAIDGMCDLLYVTSGTAVEKTGGPTREDGKILKGPDYRPPRIAAMLAELAERAE